VRSIRKLVVDDLGCGWQKSEVEDAWSMVVCRVWWWDFQKWIDLILKESNLRTRGREQIQGWGRRMGAAIGPSEVEVEPVDPLNRDKSPRVTNRASDEAIGASKEARKGGGMRKREERGKEEAVKITTSPSAVGCFRG
jgi:hypothetical protein